MPSEQATKYSSPASTPILLISVGSILIVGLSGTEASSRVSVTYHPSAFLVISALLMVNLSGIGRCWMNFIFPSLGSSIRLPWMQSLFTR